jgi:hypothetical protein
VSEEGTVRAFTLEPGVEIDGIGVPEHPVIDEPAAEVS